MSGLAINLNAPKAYLAPLAALRSIRRPRPLVGLSATEAKLFHAWRP